MDLLSCQPPLLFDTVEKVCDFIDELQCGTSCVDRPDGRYPHPHDCSLYIICRSGVTNLVKCPPPLLFDGEELACTYPENVNCSIIIWFNIIIYVKNCQHLSLSLSLLSSNLIFRFLKLEWIKYVFFCIPNIRALLSSILYIQRPGSMVKWLEALDSGQSKSLFTKRSRVETGWWLEFLVNRRHRTGWMSAWG